VSIVVAAQDLPGGSSLGADDIALADVPAAYLSPGSLADAESVLGRTIAGDIAAGEPITSSRLVTTGPRSDGLHTVPVRLADAEAADLLVPGSIVDLVLASGDIGGQVIAEGAKVITVPRRATSPGLGPSSRTAGSLIVVATDRRTAVALAAVGTQPGLGVVLR
jgi:Flp pilus assembly protein CpaB